MAENISVERGWIIIRRHAEDDGTIKLGTGAQMRFSQFDAISQRGDTPISWGHILTAPVQRLAFWRC
jgi:hypothetical protein